MDGSRILIFMDTKKGCDQITRQLRMDGWPALSIHGDKSQAERDWVLSEFKAGKSPIMTATDVAARGLGMYGYGKHNGYFLIYFIFVGNVYKHLRYCSMAFLSSFCTIQTGKYNFHNKYFKFDCLVHFMSHSF